MTSTNGASHNGVTRIEKHTRCVHYAEGQDGSVKEGSNQTGKGRDV